MPAVGCELPERWLASNRAEVKDLAVSAVAEIEVVCFVAMEIYQCKSACRDGEGFE